MGTYIGSRAWVGTKYSGIFYETSYIYPVTNSKVGLANSKLHS